MKWNKKQSGMQILEARDKKVFLFAHWMIWCIFKPVIFMATSLKALIGIISERWKIILICNLNNFLHGWMHTFLEKRWRFATKNKYGIHETNARHSSKKPQRIDSIYANWHNGIPTLCSTLQRIISCSIFRDFFSLIYSTVCILICDLFWVHRRM